ncbi:MAG: TetR/AcrR family transcriptional regulator [Chloroflexota bacterium]|nr:TetR/AcrR family transcriptional regulator [Chloroflexota bacterium]
MTDQSLIQGIGHDPEKRQRLIEAAAKQFARSGFDAASMDGIAREAGVAKGTTYLYFRGKRDLFLAVLDELRRRLDAAPAPDATQPPREALRAYVRLHLAVADAVPDLFRCYTSALFGVNRDFQEAAMGVFSWQTRQLAGLLAPGVRRPSRLQVRRAELVAASVLAASLIRSLEGRAWRGTALEEDLVVRGALTEDGRWT